MVYVLMKGRIKERLLEMKVEVDALQARFLEELYILCQQ